MRVECLDNEDYVYIHKGTEYDVLRESEIGYLLLNDDGTKWDYPKNLFAIIPDETYYYYFVSYRGKNCYGNAKVSTTSESITLEIIRDWENQMAENVNAKNVSIMFFHKL
jgi:hypothetical protein